MPYIKKDDREKLLSSLSEIGSKCSNAGELNYIFTVISHFYLENKGLRYQNINDIIGALEGAKLELYRRIVVDYEDEKIKTNGDVMILKK